MESVASTNLLPSTPMIHPAITPPSLPPVTATTAESRPMAPIHRPVVPINTMESSMLPFVGTASPPIPYMVNHHSIPARAVDTRHFAGNFGGFTASNQGGQQEFRNIANLSGNASISSNTQLVPFPNPYPHFLHVGDFPVATINPEVAQVPLSQRQYNSNATTIPITQNYRNHLNVPSRQPSTYQPSPSSLEYQVSAIRSSLDRLRNLTHPLNLNLNMRYICRVCGEGFPTPQAYGGHMGGHRRSTGNVQLVRDPNLGVNRNVMFRRASQVQRNGARVRAVRAAVAAEEIEMVYPCDTSDDESLN